MDQIKIGKYIAGKRKELGLTQLQLAEILGMSNKSVSKWERGVCLPDVSVYKKLCEALGISLNEFLAGEDLSVIDVISKSEETIIGITTEEKKRRKKAKQTISLLLIIILLVSGIVCYFLYKEGAFYRNCVVPFSWRSGEYIAANLVADSSAHIYRYYTDKEYAQLQFKYYRYKNGTLIEENVINSYTFDGGYIGEGIFSIEVDYSSAELMIGLEGEGRDEFGCNPSGETNYELPLEGMNLYDWQELYCMGIDGPDRIRHFKDDETGVLMIAYDKDLPIDLPKSIDRDGWPKGAETCKVIEENDYTDFITLKINKVK